MERIDPRFRRDRPLKGFPPTSLEVPHRQTDLAAIETSYEFENLSENKPILTWFRTWISTGNLDTPFKIEGVGIEERGICLALSSNG